MAIAGKALLFFMFTLYCVGFSPGTGSPSFVSVAVCGTGCEVLIDANSRQIGEGLPEAGKIGQPTVPAGSFYYSFYGRLAGF